MIVIYVIDQKFKYVPHSETGKLWISLVKSLTWKAMYNMYQTQTQTQNNIYLAEGKEKRQLQTLIKFKKCGSKEIHQRQISRCRWTT